MQFALCFFFSQQRSNFFSRHWIHLASKFISLHCLRVCVCMWFEPKIKSESDVWCLHRDVYETYVRLLPLSGAWDDFYFHLFLVLFAFNSFHLLHLRYFIWINSTVAAATVAGSMMETKCYTICSHFNWNNETHTDNNFLGCKNKYNCNN